MEEKRTIIIDLDNSLYAHAFTREQQIHQVDLDKAMDIIRNQVNSLELNEDADVFLHHP